MSCIYNYSYFLYTSTQSLNWYSQWLSTIINEPYLNKAVRETVQNVKPLEKMFGVDQKKFEFYCRIVFNHRPIRVWQLYKHGRFSYFLHPSKFKKTHIFSLVKVYWLHSCPLWVQLPVRLQTQFLDYHFRRSTISIYETTLYDELEVYHTPLLHKAVCCPPRKSALLGGNRVSHKRRPRDSTTLSENMPTEIAGLLNRNKWAHNGNASLELFPLAKAHQNTILLYYGHCSSLQPSKRR